MERITLAEIIIAMNVITGIYFLFLSFKIYRLGDKIDEIKKQLEKKVAEKQVENE